MTTITDVLNNISSHPYHVSSSVVDTTDHIRTETKDDNITTFKFVFNKNNDVREVYIAVNNNFLSNIPLGVNYGDIVCNQLVYCECESCTNDVGMYAYNSKFGNLGSPPTYYINDHQDHTNQGIRIKTDPALRTDQDIELYTLSSLYENIQRQPDHVQHSFEPVSDFIKNEVSDSNVISLNIKFSRDNDSRDVVLILNNDFISKLPRYIDFGDQISNGIVYCKYCTSCDQGGYGGYSTETENLGSPPTYYVDPKTGQGKRIKAFETPSVPLENKLETLISDLKQLPNVEKVELEFARHESIKNKVGFPDAVVLTVWKYRATAPILKYYSLGILYTIENNIIIDSVKELMN